MHSNCWHRCKVADLEKIFADLQSSHKVISHPLVGLIRSIMVMASISPSGNTFDIRVPQRVEVVSPRGLRYLSREPHICNRVRCNRGASKLKPEKPPSSYLAYVMVFWATMEHQGGRRRRRRSYTRRHIMIDHKMAARMAVSVNRAIHP